MSDSVIETIQNQIKDNAILLYMKGEPKAPRCGFSARAVQALFQCGAKFSYVDVLENPEVRATLPQVSQWPTFPQLFIEGELIGGSDIILELLDSGDLQKKLEVVA